MWEGPYRVVHIARPGSARLETEDGIPVANPWNIQHLRKFYPCSPSASNFLHQGRAMRHHPPRGKISGSPLYYTLPRAVREDSQATKPRHGNLFRHHVFARWIPMPVMVEHRLKATPA